MPLPLLAVTSREVTGDPILVARGKNARLRALSNVCRHRGSLLAEGRVGLVKRLLCHRGGS